MAYIDCENCYHGKVCQYRRIYHDSVVACEHWQPTADVVPKSEVKELQAKLATLRKENVELLVSKETDIYISMEKLVKARTEHPIFKAIEEKVAREIFEEIEKTVFADMDFFKELKKKYEAEASQN